MHRTSSGHLVWSAERSELYEAVGAVWRHTGDDPEWHLQQDMLAGLSDIDPPKTTTPQLEDDQLELLLGILRAECDDIHGQTYPYHPLNNVREEVEAYVEGNG